MIRRIFIVAKVIRTGGFELNMRRRSPFIIILSAFAIFLSVLLIEICLDLRGYGIEQLVFHLMVPLDGADTNVVWDTVLQNIELPVYIATAYLAIAVFSWVFCFAIKRDPKGKKRSLQPWKFIVCHIGIISSIGLFMGLIACVFIMDLPEYIQQRGEETTLFEDYYVDPAEVNIEFPEEKQNLIYIYMESMESTFADTESGGIWEYNVIPGLTRLAQNNVSFSENNQVGGLIDFAGTTWTIAAMTAQTSGLPLKLPISGNDYGEYSSFLPGVATLNNILAEQGYNQVVMFGSDKAFAGRDKYFKQHGVTEIWDYYTAIETGLIPEDYYLWWGFEDAKLYSYAKERILDLADQDAPFNFTLLTVDTHHIGGYRCDLCEEKYPTQYEDVFACADRQISEFIQWIQEQEFYENTTIVIAGDHKSMDIDFFEYYNILKTDRRVYNCFINPLVSGEYQSKNRVASTMDMFPSTLAALGVKWDGSRLGIGTNLFSSEKTLAEELGTEEFNIELKKASSFYDTHFLFGK